jgi:serine/threonine protein kinase
MGCPTDDTFGRWLDGVLEEARARELVQHTSTCAECRATSEQLQTLRTLTARTSLVVALSTPPPVELLGGKYRLGAALGRGSTAHVFDAIEKSSGRPVAVKVLHPELRGNAVWSARFLREGRTLSQVRNAHVAAVLDVGWTPDARPFLVMERLEGASLEARLTEYGPAAPQTVVNELLQICDGLAAVHGAGIVHRDLKLSNMMQGRATDGSTIVKIVDFGIARDLSAQSGPALTPQKSFLGTPYYVAPEQIQDPRNADHRADLWALGVCAYRMLTNRYPFPGDNPGQVLARVLEGAPPPLRSIRPEVSEHLETVIHRCLARDPAARYADAAALSVALALASSGAFAEASQRQTALTKRAAMPASGPGAKTSTVAFAWVATLVTFTSLGLGALVGWLLYRS